MRQNIYNNTESLASLQQQLASGKRLSKPSDDPQGVSLALTLRTTSAQYNQYLRNISSATDWLQATDSALDQISTVLTRARDVALQGATGTLDRASQEALGQEIDGYLHEAMQAVNSTQDGKYLLAGLQVGPGTAPFTEDSSGTSIVYNGDASVMEREIAPGVKLGINVCGDVSVGGDEVLTNGLQALLDMRNQLLNVGAVTAGQIDKLTTALNDVPSLRSVVGTNTQRLSDTQDALNSLQTNVTAELSQVQDADVAQVMTKLMMQESVYQAALNVGARVIQPSLLDFLTH